MKNIDTLFVGLAFLTYFSLFRNFSLFKSSLSHLNSWDFKRKIGKIENRAAFIDRVILFSLTKRNDEFQYIYYAKRVIIISAVLFAPWLVIVYFMKWYYIPTFFWSHFFVSLFVTRMPSFIFNIILDMYFKRCK